MLDILLTVILFGSMLIAFKLLGKYGVSNLQAIVVNYLVAGICGLIFFSLEGHELSLDQIMNSEWLKHASIIGLMFIAVFNALAYGAQKVGMAISTVANKMSLIVPVLAAVVLYDEKIGLQMIAGIILALLGIYFSSTNAGKISFDKKYLWLVLLLFIGQGFADTIYNDAVQEGYATNLFLSVIFIVAGILGSLMIVIQISRKKMRFQMKSIVWGIVIGIPNFGTLYFMTRALESFEGESSTVFPIVSMGIILFSAFSGLILFREKLSRTNWIGILLAVCAILVIKVL
jgi:drug/metabolite transporter (DMT)-like permease